MIDDSAVYLEKAAESLAGAESELANGRYNNCANRAYYACFQAAIAALLRSGIRTPSPSGHRSHEFVWAQFAGELINRRKLYASDLRDTFERVHTWREIADYRPDRVTQVQATRAVRRGNQLGQAVRTRGEP